MAPEAIIFIPRGKELAIRLGIEDHGGEVIEIKEEDTLNPRYKREYGELLERFGFLEGLLIRLQHPITDISVETEKKPPSTTDFRYDSGYNYLTHVHQFGDIIVHEYVTDDRRGDADCILVIYLTKTGS